MLDSLLALVSRLGHWSYLLIGLGATLKSAAFVGLLVPGETLVIFSGFLAAQGLLELGDLLVVVTTGGILGDTLGYTLGHRLGRPWLLRFGRWVGVRAERVERVDGFFAHHGGKTVFLGRFIGFLRALAPFVAGASRMPYRQFLPYNVLGGFLWSLSCVVLGYGCGASWQVADRWVGRVSTTVGGALLLVVALTWLWRTRAARKNT